MPRHSFPRGDGHPGAKLTWEIIHWIRANGHFSLRKHRCDIVRRWGVQVLGTTIRAVRDGRTWREPQ